MTIKIIGFLLILSSLVACRGGQDTDRSDTLFERIPASKTGIHFANTLRESDSLNIITFEYFYNGGGVGLGDINNDGLVDVLLGGNMTNSRLYLNKGGFTFEDITEKAGIHTGDGWATGISMVDINADGFLDIYVCRAGPYSPGYRANQLYINQKNDTFREEARAYGLNDTGHTTQAAFLDYDRDGDLDAYLVTNVMEKTGPNIIRPKVLDGSAESTDRLYRNNGNNTFTNVSRDAGILAEGYGLGVAVTDINRDGWPDIYVANDYLSNDHLYINQQNGRFAERITDYFRHQSYSAMGTDAADIDNDGLVDFVTLDMLPETDERRKNMIGLMNYDRHLSELRYGYFPQFMRNTLQHNNGPNPETGQPTFSEIGRFAGIHRTDWSWSALFADYDNDGFRDLLVTNGFPKDITNRDFVAYRMDQYQHGTAGNKSLRAALDQIPGVSVTSYLFKNNGGNLTFTNESAAWGFAKPAFSNGAAYADLDNDGDLDLVINNIDQEAFVYRNRARQFGKNNYLRIALQGPKTNPDGFGATVSLFYGSRRQVAEQSPVRGYESTVESTLHFGLGPVSRIDSVRVTWPDGNSQLLTNITPNQVLTLDYRQASPAKKLPVTPAEPLFRAVSPASGIDYKHTDEPYIDFKVQPLLPHLLSQNGPGITVGDVNGDGKDDFFVGGAFNHSGRVFVQGARNTFTGSLLTTGQKYEEDMGSLLFDADGDGDADLYVVSGSNEFDTGSVYYRDRLYLNDGKGGGGSPHFTLAPGALPNLRASGSTVNAADYDRDGDLDLFVGSRLSPGQYPLPPDSYILRNDSSPADGPRFTDVTATVAPALRKLGMVTSALWTDVDQDGWVDLLVAGEWMPITLLKNNHGTLTDGTGSAGLTHTHGWWNSLTAGDFDRDGDTDYIAGNLGLNHEWRTSPDKPVTILAGDIDKNGTVDPIICQYLGDKLCPVHPRDEMTSQMSFLRRKFTSYALYARATIDDVLSAEQQQAAYTAKSELFQSVYLDNTGHGTFSVKPLPTAAQLAPIFGMTTGDYDNDGNLDVLLTGNAFDTEATTGRYDAGNGLLLRGNGKGRFTAVSTQQSGFYVDGDAKGLAELALADGGQLVLAGRNNNTIKAFVRAKRAGIRLIRARPLDAFARVTTPDGRTNRYEFYYGSTYLSQSSRVLYVPADAVKIIFVDAVGAVRNVSLPSANGYERP